MFGLTAYGEANFMASLLNYQNFASLWLTGFLINLYNLYMQCKAIIDISQVKPCKIYLNNHSVDRMITEKQLEM